MILFALVLGTFMTALDATIVSVALPTIAEELGESGHDTSNISWILLIYTLMLCCFILLWSRIGSDRGYKKMFMLGVAIFTASSLMIGLCGFIDGLGLGAIILLRAVQGIGAGMVTSMSLAMVSTYLPKSSMGASIGMVTLAASAGTAFGPALGGILTSFHWSYIFFINVPVGLLCIILCARYMKAPETHLNADAKIDYVGAALIFAMLFTLIYYLNKGPEIGWMSDAGMALIFIFAIMAGLTAWWERRVSLPLVSLDLLSEPHIRRSMIVAMLLFMAMAGSYLLLPYYLQYVQHYETIEYGVILIANSIGMMVVGPLVGKVADKTGQNRKFVVAGALICAVGFLMMSRMAVETGLPYILISLFIMGAGIGMALVSSTNLSYSYIKEGQDGELSGLTNTFRQAGSSAGVAILNAVFLAFVVVQPGMPFVEDDLIPGFRHAFFVAILISLLAFIIAMSLRDRTAENRSRRCSDSHRNSPNSTCSYTYRISREIWTVRSCTTGWCPRSRRPF
jgi:EmrB/QacA subfamily drug resistance transporter